MLLLTLFAFVAGAGTAISPCVLPVLPALLASGASGGRRRPFGIVLGHAITFTVTIVGLSEVVDGVGFGDGVTRYLAIFALLLFGLAVLVPAIGDRFEAPLSRLSRFGPKGTGGDGFWSGVAIGGALGFVYAPCAGPILAAVITVSAASGETFAVALGYAAGSSVVLLGLALGGRRVIDKVRASGRGPVVQRAVGLVMVATAVAMAADLDIRFQTAIASSLPDVVVNPTEALEDSDSVKNRLADLRGGPSRFEAAQDKADAEAAAAAAAAAQVTPSPGSGADLPGVTTPELPMLGPAPDFRDNRSWLNTPGNRPITLSELRGKVTLIDFWTYTCINCIRTLPYLKAWDEEYRDKGLTIVGVHAPEFAFEKKRSNVVASIRQNELKYPVVQDNDMKTWNAWGNQYWPAKYLIDAEGQVRYVHFGEGEYEETEAAIRTLLAEAGTKRFGDGVRAKDTIAVTGSQVSPETYLGSQRASGFVPVGPTDGTEDYQAAPLDELELNTFTLGGRWKVDEESSTAVTPATITGRVQAKRVYLVLSSAGDAARSVTVKVDGRPYRTVKVDRQELYELVDLPSAREFVLEVGVPTGVSGFAFTFG